MKKILFVLLISLLLLSLCACDRGKEDADGTTANGTTVTTTSSTTTEPKPAETPQSVYAEAKKSSAGVYSVTRMNNETGDYSEFTFAIDEKGNYRIETGGVIYTDKGDCGYLASDSFKIRLTGDEYEDFRILANEKIATMLPDEVDLTDATLEEDGDELIVNLNTTSDIPCALTYTKSADGIVFSQGTVYSQGEYFMIERIEDEPNDHFDSYEDKSELLPLLTAMLRVTASAASVSGSVVFTNETDTYTGAFSSDSRIHFPENEFWLDATLIGTQDETPLRLQLLCNDTIFSFTFSDLLTVVFDRQELDSVLQYLLLFSDMPQQDLSEIPEPNEQDALPEPTVTFEDGNVIIAFEGEAPFLLTVSVGENDEITVSLSPLAVPSIGTFSAVTVVAPIAQSAVLPQKAPDAPVYLETVGLTDLLTAIAPLSGEAAYQAKGTIALNAASQNLTVNYEALFESGENPKAYITLKIPFLPSLTDAGVYDFIPLGCVAYNGAITTVIRIENGFVYIDKTVTAEYSNLLFQSGKKSKTYRTKMTVSDFSSDLEGTFLFLLNINVEALEKLGGSVASVGEAKLYLAESTPRVLSLTHDAKKNNFILQGNLYKAAELLRARGLDVQIPELPAAFSDTDIKLTVNLKENEDEYGMSFYTLGTVTLSLALNDYISLSVTADITAAEPFGDDLTLFPTDLAANPAYPLYPTVN